MISRGMALTLPGIRRKWRERCILLADEPRASWFRSVTIRAGRTRQSRVRVVNMSDFDAPDGAAPIDAAPAVDETPAPPPERHTTKKQSVHLLDAVTSVPMLQNIIGEAWNAEAEAFKYEDMETRTFFRPMSEQLYAPEDYVEQQQTGRLQYLRKCSELNIAPCGRFLRCIDTDVAPLSHYGLGEDGMVALAECLTVCGLCIARGMLGLVFFLFMLKPLVSCHSHLLRAALWRVHTVQHNHHESVIRFKRHWRVGC
jgi:hypothetical protein